MMFPPILSGHGDHRANGDVVLAAFDDIVIALLSQGKRQAFHNFCDFIEPLDTQVVRNTWMPCNGLDNALQQQRGLPPHSHRHKTIGDRPGKIRTTHEQPQRCTNMTTMKQNLDSAQKGLTQLARTVDAGGTTATRKALRRQPKKKDCSSVQSTALDGRRVQIRIVHFQCRCQDHQILQGAAFPCTEYHEGLLFSKADVQERTPLAHTLCQV
mmetsp:Transcript_62603/g.167687  ORF Transcript_62603/g.167687 Transcript_62603/m.167687 type:complete len:212 (-) Transcript_62603:869-1504(-)